MPLHAVVEFNSNAIPRRHVGGRGPMDAEIVFVGEAPGRHENATGLPFVGDAGSEMSRYCLWAGVDLATVYITNLSKRWPFQDSKGKQLPPSPEEIKRDEAELLTELAIVGPKIIVAIGAYAARYFLGSAFQTMRRDHGIPRTLESGVIVLPVYHPAAGIHNEREQVNIQEDFMQLGRLIRGQIPPHPPIDEHPIPCYARLTDKGVSNYVRGPHAIDGIVRGTGPEMIAYLLAGATEIAIDTEGTIADPWCLTFSVRPGEAWLIRATETECLAALNAHINAPHSICTVICHYLAHDIPVCAAMGVDLVARRRAVLTEGMRFNEKWIELPVLSLRCTMSEAYLLGTEPKGLKPLSWRLSGMEMQSYEELVGPTEVRIVDDYLWQVWDALKCSTCNSAGELPVISTKMVADPACTICFGAGKLLVGKHGNRLKNPKPCGCRTEQAYELKTKEKCPTCVGGLLIPMPEREFIFDSQKQEWRWKQPQSLAKWIRKRLKNGAADNEAAEIQVDGEESIVEGAAEEAEDEPATSYFKIRRDWSDLAGRSDRAYVDAVVGRLRRTTLSDVADQDAVTRYACADADATLRDAPKLEARLLKLDLAGIREQDAAFIPMLSRMEQVGMKIDRPHLERLHQHLIGRMNEVRDRLSTLLGDRTNPNSPKLVDLLFKDLRLPTIKLTKSGKRESIDDDAIGALRAKLKKSEGWEAKIGLQVLDCITEYREALKIDDYPDKMLEYADRNDRLHTTLSYTTAATGRLTSSEPINAQTFPNPDNYPDDCPPELNYGQQVRSGIIEDDGFVLISADYAQIEMVVGAHLTQDAGMLQVFREGLDLHKYAASLMFGIPYAEVPKRVRTQVKPINFGAFYGIGPEKLQMQLATLPSGAIDKTFEECEELLHLYFQKFPDILSWKQRLWEEGERNGYVRDLFGRIRWMPGLRSNIRKIRSAAEREAGNMPVQSTANGIIRIASRILWERDLPMMRRGGIEIDPVHQTHDDNVFRCPREHAETCAIIVADTMKNAVKLSVPIKVDVKIGRNLYEVK